MTTPEAGAANEAAKAEAPAAPPPTQISEIHRLKLQLSKEFLGRLQAEAINLQMAQKQVSVSMQKGHGEQAALMEEIRAAYQLAEGDNITAAGNIERAPKKAPPAEQPPAATA